MSLHQALRDAADTLPAPMAQELGAALSRIDAGATVEEALSDLDRRLDLPGFYLVARAVTVAERRGGPLPRLLAKIGRTLQETERVEHRIETETSGVRLASRLMAAMPLLIGVFLYMASPEHVTMLFTTLAGNLVLDVRHALLPAPRALTIAGSCCYRTNGACGPARDPGPARAGQSSAAANSRTICAAGLIS
jgi:tight adherence protein B